MFPTARRPAPRRESHRRYRDRPIFWPREPVSKAAANPRYAGSTGLEASTAPPDWFSPAIPAADRHSNPTAPSFHVKRASARGRRFGGGPGGENLSAAGV